MILKSGKISRYWPRVPFIWKNLPPNDWKPVEDWPARMSEFAVPWQVENSPVQVKLQVREIVHQIRGHFPRQSLVLVFFQIPHIISLKQKNCFFFSVSLFFFFFYYKYINLYYYIKYITNLKILHYFNNNFELYFSSKYNIFWNSIF